VLHTALAAVKAGNCVDIVSVSRFCQPNSTQPNPTQPTPTIGSGGLLSACTVCKSWLCSRTHLPLVLGALGHALMTSALLVFSANRFHDPSNPTCAQSFVTASSHLIVVTTNGQLRSSNHEPNVRSLSCGVTLYTRSIYFIEDWTLIGKDAQEFSSRWQGIGYVRNGMATLGWACRV
jgi:hypothetical protein